MQYLGNQAVQAIGRTKNLFDILELPYATSVKVILKTQDSITVTAAGTYKAHAIPIKNGESLIGKQLTLSFNVSQSKSGAIPKILCAWMNGGSVLNIFLNTAASTSGFFQATDIVTAKPEDYPDSVLCLLFYANVNGVNDGTNNITYSNVQLNEGDTTLPYQPYIQRYDMYLYNNLVKMPYVTGNTTINGVTFTVDEKTGWITANGTNNGNSFLYTLNSVQNVKAGKYYAKYFVVNASTPENAHMIQLHVGGAYVRNYSIKYAPTIEITPEQERQGVKLVAVCYHAAGVICNDTKTKIELVKLIGD